MIISQRVYLGSDLPALLTPCFSRPFEPDHVVRAARLRRTVDWEAPVARLHPDGRGVVGDKASDQVQGRDTLCEVERQPAVVVGPPRGRRPLLDQVGYHLHRFRRSQRHVCRGDFPFPVATRGDCGPSSTGFWRMGSRRHAQRRGRSPARVRCWTDSGPASSRIRITSSGAPCPTARWSGRCPLSSAPLDRAGPPLGEVSEHVRCRLDAKNRHCLGK
jgi:hypothetical protein